MKFLQYFIDNSRLNYAILFFLLYLGVNAYINIPKEIFPSVELDKISVRGTYAGASASTMDKMAVRDIEDALSNISGIDKTETTIAPGAFTMILTLDENAKKIDVLNSVKDAVSLSKEYLPSDMLEPTSTLMNKTHSLIKLSISSKTLSRGILTKEAQEIKSKLSKIKNISEISIWGDSKEELSIRLNSQKILAYGLKPSSVVNAIKNLSYIFPIGNIEEKGNFAFISTVNGKTDINDWKESILSIDGKYIRLGDIADVKKLYPQTSTMATYNNNATLTLVISKGEEGNAVEISKELRAYIQKISPKYRDVIFSFYQDRSIPIEKRLDIVIANLMFGLILVFLSMYVLINFRIALIVAVGIPFSFIIGLLFIYYLGYSINVVSLLGALIVIGIVVDDAIVVSENIQRHIDDGMDVREASLVGVKEMMLPVSLATITTIVAFLPMFLMQGEIALFLILVPIVVVMILIGSLIESFFFLPLHAREMLKKSNNWVDWSGIQNLYEKILSFHIHYKKSFLLAFLVVIPILTLLSAKSMKFQFFPNFDGNNLYVTAKLDINTPIKDTYKIAKELEAYIIDDAKEFSLKSISSTTGYRRSLSGETEFNNNVFFITLELYDREDSNWVSKYINPVLDFSFDFNDSDKRRKLKTFELAPRLDALIEPFKKRYKMVELGVTADKPGLIRSDIQVNLSGSEDRVLEEGIEKLEDALSKINGVSNFSNNIKYGKMEYKIKINAYGESLGVSEASVSKVLSDYFLERRQATTFNTQGVMEIKTEDSNKDKIQTLLNFNIALDDGRYVKLIDIAQIIKIRDYESINKLNGSIVKTVYANLDKRVITPDEVIEKLEPILKEIASKGVEVNLLGEKEKKKQLKGDMKSTLILALFLIFITLLFIFSKVKYVLMVMSVIPLSVLGALVGHKIIGMPLTMPSLIGILGLSGVVINDGIIMLDFLHGTRNSEEFFTRAKHRLRPILITSITTFLGLFTLIFYASGQAVILQPIAISLGFGLLWGTLLNLIYLPTLYAMVNGIKPKS